MNMTRNAQSSILALAILLGTVGAQTLARTEIGPLPSRTSKSVAAGSPRPETKIPACI